MIGRADEAEKAKNIIWKLYLMKFELPPAFLVKMCKYCSKYSRMKNQQFKKAKDSRKEDNFVLF